MSDEDWAPPEPTPLERATDTAPRAAAVDVPGYADLTEVARGGDSIVYRARQVSVDRDVAIKVIQVADPATAARFQRELEITVRLGRAHPHIVTVLDTTTASDGSPCLIMDFHDLGSLHDRLLDHGPLPVSEVVEAGTAVADALAFAHAGGVLHRDVKPQNVLLLPTSYVLSDFGIARMADAGHTASLERFSYRHASPQVLDGLAPTVADDVWSLGSTLFTLLEGRAPFSSDDPDDDTALAYLRRVRTGRRRPLRRDDLPEGLRDLVEGCLVADRDERVGTAEIALARLRSLRTEGRSWEPGAATADAQAGTPAHPPTTAGPTGSTGDPARAAAPAAAGRRDEPIHVEPSAPTGPPPEEESAAAIAPSTEAATSRMSASSWAEAPAAGAGRRGEPIHVEPSAPIGPPPDEESAAAAVPPVATEPSSAAAGTETKQAGDLSAPAPAQPAAAEPSAAAGPSAADVPTVAEAPAVARSALADLAGHGAGGGPARPGTAAGDTEATGLFAPTGAGGTSGAGASGSPAGAGGRVGTGGTGRTEGSGGTGGIGGTADASASGAGGAATDRPGERAGWRRIAAFIGGMLLAGAAIGVGAALLRGNEAPEQPPAPTDDSVPTATGPAPAQTGPPQASVSDPALAPQGFAVAGQGTSALLTWAPPSGSIDFLVVVRLVEGEEPAAVANLPADAREYTVEGLDPDSPSCFAVVGYGRADGAVEAGSTAEQCTG